MNKVRVLLDSHQTPFSERYKSILQSHDVDVEDLYIPTHHPESYQAYIRYLGQSPAKSVHFLWAYHHWSALVIPRLLHKRVILHWIGSDVVKALQHPRIPWRLLGSTHLVMDNQQAQELSRIGIEATVVRAPCNFPNEVPPWPHRGVVLTYIPKDFGDLYGQDIIMWLAEQLPHIQFVITANDGANMPQYPNILYTGWLNEDQMNTLYSQSKVILRLTKHDAGASMAMEALARNRYVLWTKPYPHCELVSLDNRERIKQILVNCWEDTEPNDGAREAVLTDFDNEKIAQQLIQIYKGGQ